MRHVLPTTLSAGLAGALAVLMLAACQPQAPDGEPAPPPADAAEAPAPPEEPDEPETPKEFTGDIDARGTEPFWAVQIRADNITLTRPDPEPAVVAANPGANDDGQKAVWSTTANGKTFMVSLAHEDCSDGMSNLNYPYLAVITLGDLTFRGCANKVGQQPREDGK